VGDPGRLRQVLVNLVSNAIKFTARGEVVVRVEAEAQTAEAGWVHVAVSDTGIGITAEKQQLILEPFMQADGSMTRKYGGTGLGLAISKQLVELMGGRLWIDSTPGQGSTFHFTAGFGVQAATTTGEVQSPTVDFCGVRVLVVDDNATNRHILHEILAHWQMQPYEVDGGAAALTALAQANQAGVPVPLVLIDAQMPEMDGFTLAARIKADPTLADATILMLSSADLPEATARCREMGIAIYLVKPIAQADLREAIVTALQRPVPNTHAAPPVPQRPWPEPPRSLRILLAEDNVVNQRLVVRMLEKRGHQIAVAGNGKEALAALDRQTFDVVLMDVQMPEFDGLQATAAIRAQERISGAHLPIVALTAHAMQGDKEGFLAAGMDAYLSKPMKADDLFATIDRLVTAGMTMPTAHDDSDARTAAETMDG
jgi:CheY-like chemotaxis protein